MFSPGEELVDLEVWKQEKEQEYIDHFNEEREETFEALERNFDFKSIGDMVGLLPSIEWRKYGTRVEEILKDKSKLYLNYFVDKAEQSIDGYTDDTPESARAAQPGVEKM
jgi:hypothetical protein